ncbi:MarR family winged helix-turn-helix transcriptional regulator [Paenibacillus bovis]|uniref:MarR family transcriptional regulator n=1 Tax=Paenibacillus bovis TaxID=1616788 RepID=A0A172ZCZ8_9BACL|nr:MarR family transcriptional regulator [Paenibacillus bovis]ANF95383.1 MarR family transcriptional regulator [Paenibacillus bovis]
MPYDLENSYTVFIRDVHLAIAGYIKNKLAPFNLAPEQTFVLMLLWKKDGLAQNEIGERLGKDKTNITRMISNLESKGFIRKITCTDDRRCFKIYLTPEGAQLEQEVAVIMKEISLDLMDGISDDELIVLRRLLNKIKDNARVNEAATAGISD